MHLTYENTKDPVLWQALAVLKGMLDRAQDRCGRLAASEKMLGYADSAMQYRDLSQEIGASYPWVYEVIAGKL